MQRIPTQRALLGAISWMTLTCVLAAQQEVPAPLGEFLMGARHRPVRDLAVGGLALQAIDKPLGTPYLVWPRRAGDGRAPAQEIAATRDWLTRASQVLQHTGFTPEFVSRGETHGVQYLRYQLAADGIPLWDHRVDVYFRAGRFLGLTSETPVDISSREVRAAERQDAGEHVWFADRASGRTEIVLANVERSETATHRSVKITRRGRVLAHDFEQKSLPPIPALATFTEWAVPGGAFPDQIAVDALGKVWFSDPSANVIYAFEPRTQTFQSITNTSGSGPDGLCVDDRGRVWWGNYYSSSLGLLDSATTTFKAFAAPYTPASPAVPCTTQAGTLWITDHQNNRISHFNLLTQTWIGSYVMPTAACWVVGGVEDPNRRDVWFTEFNANKMAKVTPSGVITEIITPPGGPAFATVCQDQVYWSEWNRNRIGVYDPKTQAVTGYAFPLASEIGGPIASTSRGQVVVGTRNTGYVMVFDIKTATFTAFQVPTPGSGFKDGITVGPDNAVWFTETSARKIGRLVLP